MGRVVEELQKDHCSNHRILSVVIE